MDCREIAATIHADMCNDERNGYSWSPRWGGDWGEDKTLWIDGRSYTYPLGSWDCSSSTVMAWRLAIQYTKFAGMLDGATYTGNMRDVFVNSGLFDVWDTNSTEAERGDLYLNEESHVAMCQYGGQDGSWDSLSEFSINEFGDVYNGQVGDQTGWESHITGFYNFPWDLTLHYNGRADSTSGDSGDSTYIPDNPDAPIPAITFRVKTKKGGWLSDGVEGDGSAIVGIAIDFGGHGWYQVKTQKHGWLEKVWSCNIDDEDGYAGWEDSEIIAVRCYYETPNPSETGYFVAKYRVSDEKCRAEGEDYWPWQFDDDENNGQDGYAGDDVTIDKFYIEISR